MIQYETRGHRRTREQGGKEGREGKVGKVEVISTPKGVY
jgi:hypothetical protein